LQRLIANLFCRQTVGDKVGVLKKGLNFLRVKVLLRHPFLQVNDDAATVDVERGQVGIESIFSENFSVHRLTKRASIRPRSDFHQRKPFWVNDFHPAKPDSTGDRNPNTRNQRGISLALRQLPKLLKVDGHLLSPPFATR
jgi:hypothetical protein